MGLFVNNQGQRSELQTKVAADLRKRLNAKPSIEAEKVESTFLDNTNQTRKTGPIIAILFLLGVIGSVVVLAVM